MGHGRANRQWVLTYERSRCDEILPAVPSLLGYARGIHPQLKNGVIINSTCVTMTTFDFTPHRPRSCLTIQQHRQCTAASKSCRGAHLSSPQAPAFVDYLPIDPAACAGCTHTTGQPRAATAGFFFAETHVCSKGQQGHAMDTMTWYNTNLNCLLCDTVQVCHSLSAERSLVLVSTSGNIPVFISVTICICIVITVC